LVYFYADADIPSAFGISNNAKWSRLEVKTSNNRIESIQLRDEASIYKIYLYVEDIIFFFWIIYKKCVGGI